jgi:hypothetical protein
MFKQYQFERNLLDAGEPVSRYAALSNTLQSKFHFKHQMALELFTVILYLSDVIVIVNLKDPYCHTSFSNDVASFFSISLLSRELTIWNYIFCTLSLLVYISCSFPHLTVSDSLFLSVSYNSSYLHSGHEVRGGRKNT